MRDLADINRLVKSWQQVAIESERSRMETMAASIEQFVKFRTELVRLAREESTAKARLFGDNDANRKVRSDLNSRLNDLGKVINQMDEATQQNSALVEENAATAKTLEEQARAMQERVGFFKFDGPDEAGSANPQAAGDR